LVGGYMRSGVGGRGEGVVEGEKKDVSYICISHKRKSKVECIHV